MTIAIKPTASGATIEQNGSTILTVDGSGNITPSNDLYPKVPTFSAYLSSNQSFSSSTWTKVTFDVEEFDTNSNFASSRFTPTVEGYYQVNTNVRMNYTGTAGDYTIVMIYKNGSIYGIDSTVANVTGNWGGRATGGILYMNGSTDYVEVFVWANHGSPFLQAVNNSCRFSAALVSV